MEYQQGVKRKLNSQWQLFAVLFFRAVVQLIWEKPFKEMTNPIMGCSVTSEYFQLIYKFLSILFILWETCLNLKESRNFLSFFKYSYFLICLHLSPMRKLREMGLFHLEKRRLREVSYEYLEGVWKQSQILFCHRTREARGTNRNTGGSLWTSGSTFSQWGWLETGTVFPER